MVTFFLGLLTGMLTGTLPTIIHDWYVNRKQKQVIQKTLLLEAAYNHEATMKLILDRHSEEWPDGPFSELFTESYPTTVYDAWLQEINQLLAPDVALQIHYYYANVKYLYEFRQRNSPVNEQLIKSYLERTAHTFSMLYGMLDLLSGKPSALLGIVESVKVVEEYDYYWKSDAQVLRKYGKEGAAISIEKERSRTS